MLSSLDLVEAPGPGQPAHLSAESGLVRVGKFLYVVADDEHHLGMFAATGGAMRLLLVTDADDASVPALLLSVLCVL